MSDYNILRPVKWAIGGAVLGAAAYFARDYLFDAQTEFSALELLAWSGIGSGICALRAAVARDRIRQFDDILNENKQENGKEGEEREDEMLRNFRFMEGEKKDEK